MPIFKKTSPDAGLTGMLAHPEPRATRTVHSVDGTALHVREYGDPTLDPIVLVHGWSVALEFWNPQINALVRGNRVIAYDQRGHGRSDAGVRPFSDRVLAEDFSAVLAATISPAAPATVVGHSMGGVTVLSWAKYFPDDVARYVHSALLANTATGLSDGPESMHRHQDWLSRWLTAMAMAPLPSPPRRLTRSMFRKLSLTPEAPMYMADFVQRLGATCPPRVRSQWAKVVQRIDASAGVEALRVPTTVLYGARDGLLPPGESARTAEMFRAARHLEREIVLADSGHASNVQYAEEFNAEIVRLRGLSSQPIGLTCS
ncbi:MULTISPECIES: alpha/beta hydrolase [unclassified Mycobacterium]|uniref:alpha/beta fold hydrolase n=1 Tax=unclassified Mycobacterium TaxID=2642494 RepID=UPI00068C0230|nr:MULTISPECIES: alpha/beta hydrolase [unclassified Mycobacterium]SEA60901.1 Pimeloyl-ACP methyl ester carboxylesterase [Mycobacterium sp. 283mftsu]